MIDANFIYSFTKQDYVHLQVQSALFNDFEGKGEQLIRRSIFKGHYYKDSEVYQIAKEIFLDLTMSCNIDESISWQEFFMKNAYGLSYQDKSIEWQGLYLAAFDIWKNLKLN